MMVCWSDCVTSNTNRFANSARLVSMLAGSLCAAFPETFRVPCALIRSRPWYDEYQVTGVVVHHAFVLVPAQQYVGQFLALFREFPPSQKGGNFYSNAMTNLSECAKKD